MSISSQQVKFLQECIETYSGREVQDVGELKQFFQTKRLPKGSQYLRSGEIWGNFSVVVNGVFRLYYIDDNGKEHTKGLFYENQVLAPCAPSAIRCPVNFNIESFEETEILTANYGQVRAYLESTDWGPFLLIGLLERIFDEKVDREYSWLNLDAESRYLRFIAREPELQQRLPLYIVANYLGMTDVTLSRIRKKLGLT